VRKIKLKCVNNENKNTVINNRMISTIETPPKSNYRSTRNYRFNKEGIPYTVIQNCSPYAIWTNRNENMGYAEHPTEELKSENLDSCSKFIKEVCINSV
jgi:hypothetical protein